MSDIESTKAKKPKISTSSTVNEEKICAHWVKRKKRFCKMTVAKGRDYCGEHEPPVEAHLGEKANDEDRIPCPLDAKHTVYKRNLQKHLKICNARQQTDEPAYIEKNINAGDDVDTDFQQLKLSDLSDEEFYGVIAKVKELHEKYVDGQIETLQVQHKLLDDELAKAQYGKESRKHLLQTAALLGILENEKQLKSDTSFIEFGAGKGQLAYYLAQLLHEQKNSQVILLDRMSLRHKKDNKIADKTLVQRIRADIADFRMSELKLLQQTTHCVALSKHLCGAATDLSLRCITQNSETTAANTEFIMIALCCHHRCDWRAFVGKPFCQQHNITPRQFVIITKMVSWAICGTGMSRERRRALETQQLTEQELIDMQATQRLSLVERERIGFMCKRVLDYARLEYLREHGYMATLKYYVPRDVTLENVCLIAKKLQ